MLDHNNNGSNVMNPQETQHHKFLGFAMLHQGYSSPQTSLVLNVKRKGWSRWASLSLNPTYGSVEDSA